MSVKTKQDIQNAFNISIATVNNWIKTGIIPEPSLSGYSETEFNDIIATLSSDKSNKLKGRANRSKLASRPRFIFEFDNSTIRNCLAEALLIHEKSSLTIEQSIFCLSLKLLKLENLLSNNWDSEPATEIESFLSSWRATLKTKNNFSYIDYPTPKEFTTAADFLGAFYLSARSTAERSNFGSYYTPPTLLQDLSIPSGSKVLDPCCGSGSILINVVEKGHDSSLIYAYDVDELALKICRINLTLHLKDANARPNIMHRDIIFDTYDLNKFDFILTNPPWGSKFTHSQKMAIRTRYSNLDTTESFSIALANSLISLKPKGRLYFFLPSSFLNVSEHREIRQLIFCEKYIIKLKMLGNAFKGVMSEAVRLELSEADSETGEVEVEINNGEVNHKLPLNTILPPDYIVTTNVKREDAEIIRRVFERPHLTLKDNAIFAMGIVTGNNANHISECKTDKSEPIYRGKEILPFGFASPSFFIEFTPEKYQQVASVELFRQRKIVYRFIADRLVCAIDEENRLILNSANFFIPTFEYPWETIVLLFNSQLYTFLYRKIFSSKKVLKNHIEYLPLPILSDTEHALFKGRYHDILMGKIENHHVATDMINKLFGLPDFHIF